MARISRISPAKHREFTMKHRGLDGISEKKCGDGRWMGLLGRLGKILKHPSTVWGCFTSWKGGSWSLDHGEYGWVMQWTLRRTPMGILGCVWKSVWIRRSPVGYFDREQLNDDSAWWKFYTIHGDLQTTPNGDTNNMADSTGMGPGFSLFASRSDPLEHCFQGKLWDLRVLSFPGELGSSVTKS